MYTEERPSGILCGGKEPVKAMLACAQPSCTTYGMVCGREECECMGQHAEHHMVLINGLDKVISAPPALPENYARLEKGVSQTIRRWIAELQSLELSHNAHIAVKVLASHKHGVLKRKLINREPMELKEATGGAVAEMLREIREVSAIKNPYHFQ